MSAVLVKGPGMKSRFVIHGGAASENTHAKANHAVSFQIPGFKGPILATATIEGTIRVSFKQLIDGMFYFYARKTFLSFPL